MKRIGLLLLVALGLALNACGPKSHFIYRPAADAPHVTGPTYTVSIFVEDNRPYVLSGDKPLDFVGINRSGFGVPRDTTTRGRVPFASQLKRDLSQDLQNAGYTVVQTGAERYIEISIVESRFDCLATCRMWYELHVQIKDSSKEILYSNVVSGEITSGEGGYDRISWRNVYKLYTQTVQNLIRKDPAAMAVLTRPAQPTS